MIVSAQWAQMLLCCENDEMERSRVPGDLRKWKMELGIRWELVGLIM
jgi:hypothetical protein